MKMLSLSPRSAQRTVVNYTPETQREYYLLGFHEFAAAGVEIEMATGNDGETELRP